MFTECTSHVFMAPSQVVSILWVNANIIGCVWIEGTKKSHWRVEWEIFSAYIGHLSHQVTIQNISCHLN